MFQEEIARIRKLGVQGVSPHTLYRLMQITDKPIAFVSGSQLPDRGRLGVDDVEGTVSGHELGIAYCRGLIVRHPS